MFINAVIDRIKAMSVNFKFNNNDFSCDIIASPHDMFMQNISQTEM